MKEAEKIMYQGKIFEVVQFPVKVGSQEVIFEKVRRSPGTRLIIIKNDQILLTKEFRQELGMDDYRLPGGKVFDTLKEYNNALHQDLTKEALKAAKRECLEETGLLPTKIALFDIVHAGATVDWDLFYFLVKDFDVKKQRLEEGEWISVEWKTFAEAKAMCLNRKISEDRTVGVLLRFLLTI